MESTELRRLLLSGLLIPAHPLALTADRRLNEQRQRALTRYYIASGVGGIAVGVHTTQFAIRDPQHSLLRPVLELASEEIRRASRKVVGIAGICGRTPQAVHEAELARELGFDLGLVSLSGLGALSESELLNHVHSISDVIPVFGFYLQPAVGGRVLSFQFWRQLAELPRLFAVKIAPFNRYQTLDVVRGIAESGREDVALYTGNDDNIVADLVTPFSFGGPNRKIVGGLLGHWAVWTRTAVDYFQTTKMGENIQQHLALGVEITDCNSAFFDAANNFRGCIAGLHEVLRRQGLLEGIWCLDENEILSPGQAREIDRVYQAYPHLNDDRFVRENLDRWLS